MRIKAQGSLVLVGFLSAASLLAQDIPLPSGSIKTNLPDGSPLLIAGFTDQSRATARGTRSARPVRKQAESSRRNAPRPWT